MLEHGFNNQLGSFVQAYESDVLDASNLRIPLANFLPWNDPRVTGTVEATKRILAGPDGLIYRYRVAPGSRSAPDPSRWRRTRLEVALEACRRGRTPTMGCAVARVPFWLRLLAGGKPLPSRPAGRGPRAIRRLASLLRSAGSVLGGAGSPRPATVWGYPQAFTHIG